MSSLSKTKKATSSSSSNLLSSGKKQFPSISLSKQLQDYKGYRAIEKKKKYPDLQKNTTFNLSPQQKSMLLNGSVQMPPINNCNKQMSSMQGFLLMQSGRIQKLQRKVLKGLLVAGVSVKREEEWRLYMTKSQLIEKSQQFEEIEEYLLKFISRGVDRLGLGVGSVQDSSVNNNINNNNNDQTIIMQEQQTGIQISKLVTNNNNNSLKKASQPSLRVLKQQHSINNNNSNNIKDSSFLQNDNTIIINNTNNNRTFGNLNKHELIQRMQTRHTEQLNKLTFQRSLLQKKLELYQTRIINLQAKLNQQNIPLDQVSSRLLTNDQTKPHASRKHTPAEDVLMSNIINQNKYKSQAEVKKMQNQTLIKQLNVIKQFSFKVKIQNQRLMKLLDALQKQCIQCRQYKKYKQLWLMQCQQTIGWKSLWKQRKDETFRLNNKIKILKQKNKQLLHSFNFSMVVHPDQEQDKQQLENIIKGFQQWLKVMSIPRVNAAIIDTKALLEDMTIKEKQYMPDPQNLNYKLLKPNFFIFFEAYEKTIMMEKNILNTRPLEPSFYVKIRAIFDSMYNHFNSYNHYKYWTSFPEFVIGFLEKYQISYITMKMQTRKKPMPSQEKLTFLMNLFNKKLSNTWQCDMFRSFILQEYALDQIFFFLDCRNDLNGGSALTHGFGTIDPVSYVKLSKALATTQRKLFPYENYVIQRVKSIIKSRKTQKNGQMFIDRHFVLKLLLQVYALQKTKSEKIFEASFKTKSNKKATVSYTDYFSFMCKNFQFLTTVDVCELYRETYSLTSGKINHKAVHYICQTKGLFIPLIWSKRLNMNVLQKSLNNDMILLDLQNNARKMDGHLGQFGVQEVGRLQNELNYFLRQLDWYRNNRQVFYFKVQQIKMRIQKANCLLDWQSSTYTPNQLLSTQQIREGILQLHNLIHQSDNSIKLLANKKQQKQKAIKRITHNFKVRIQQSMREFKRVDDDQLRKLKQQMAIEIKLREMRQRHQQGDDDQDQTEKVVQKKNVGIGNSLANAAQMVADNKTNSSQNNSSSKSKHSIKYTPDNDEIAEQKNQDSDKQQPSVK